MTRKIADLIALSYFNWIFDEKFKNQIGNLTIKYRLWIKQTTGTLIVVWISRFLARLP